LEHFIRELLVTMKDILIAFAGIALVTLFLVELRRYAGQDALSYMMGGICVAAIFGAVLLVVSAVRGQ
jgi:hypothetical protein